MSAIKFRPDASSPWQELPLLKGETGPAGANGKSAYQIALDNGFSGTEQEWLESLKAGGGVTEARVQEMIDASIATIANYEEASF